MRVRACVVALAAAAAAAAAKVVVVVAVTVCVWLCGVVVLRFYLRRCRGDVLVWCCGGLVREVVVLCWC